MARRAIRRVVPGKGSQKEPKRRRAIRKTDVGTILLHWTLVGLLTVATATGLRITLDSPDAVSWLHAFDALLPQSIVWTAHIPAGTALTALAISYTIYLMKSGLFRRVRPDLSRLRGLAGRAAARYSAVNILLYWVLFSSLLVLLVTGALLYLGYGGRAAELHLIATWVVIAYVPCHIAVHYAIDGKYQLLRVFNPGKLSPPPPAFDPFELIAARAEQPGDRAAPPPQPPHPNSGEEAVQQQPQRGPQQQRRLRLAGEQLPPR
jgi:cytochrome b subunit of formate dehydrogenase